MPELPEVEVYRRLAEATALERRVDGVERIDPLLLRRGLTTAGLTGALVGRRFVSARRVGKLLVLDTDGGPPLGLRFGMTGRLHVDGAAAIERLLHAPAGLDDRWDRLAVRFADGGRLGLSDPRRLGGVEIDPDEDALGPDALTVGARELAAALAGSSAPLKARLLDQSRVAGVGNLVADEVLWRNGFAPCRPAGSLGPEEVRRLARGVRSTLAVLLRRGGSHTGDLVPHRRPGGRCPRDGSVLTRSVVGGRTTWWCSRHQR